MEEAIFAGGCFWGLEATFQQQEGVVEAISGYTGGNTTNPTYEEVSSGVTGHFEAVKVIYDPNRISYEELLQIFWDHIDPILGPDIGPQYRTAIFYADERQRKAAEKSKKNRDVVTQILPAQAFYPAEEYHQNYFSKKYGTDFSGKPLTDLQYRVTHKGATEPAFGNEYWDNKEEGIYVDILTGEPLFSSQDKFDSGTGWPSFTKPLKEDAIKTKREWTGRTEVHTKTSHLGHVFKEATGTRYCINSAALHFIPKKHLQQEGYSEYKKLFSENSK
ncbi:MAG: peptide-methionine (S)-S-oxide reductase MsrA [Candidatus Woesearchaeota archaeon]